MKRTIGVFAHVDAGKTTFCEALLHQANVLRQPGRVDSQNTLMDHDPLEKRRGITIFSDIAYFTHGEREYYLVDTPGHMDFSAEMERVLQVLDGAILLIGATSGVQSHTMTLYRLLREKGIPIFGFINKMDIPTADLQRCLDDIRRRCTEDIFFLPGGLDPGDIALQEWLCEHDDALLEKYLAQDCAEADVLEALQRTVRQDTLLLQAGSALLGEGVDALLSTIDRALVPREYGYEGFAGRAFKVSYDRSGSRVTFVKCLSGILRVKQEISLGELAEKPHELRAYQGESYVQVQEARAGDIVGLTGLSQVRPGMGLGAAYAEEEAGPALRPALRTAVHIGSGAFEETLAALRRLEAQDPLLTVEPAPDGKTIELYAMGKVQIEVLEEILRERYHLDIAFGECNIAYRETIAEPVVGYGHFEPLRHYAEVHLRMEPNPGRGIEYFSEYHVDRLPLRFQNQIRQTVLSGEHRGGSRACRSRICALR